MRLTFNRLTFNILAIAAAMATTALLPPPAKAERVCRQECSAGVCKEECVESADRDRERVIIEGRGERHEEKREDRREPGIELKVPGVGVEIGR